MDSTKVVAPKVAPVAAKQSEPATAPIATQTTGPSGKPQGGGEDRRRSQRVLLRVRAKLHVAWQGTPTTFEVTTLNVNVHGALVIMLKSLPVETRLVLEHCGTRERMACRVVRPARETPDGFHTALEFDTPAPQFWKIAFPPTNWRSDDL